MKINLIDTWIKKQIPSLMINAQSKDCPSKFSILIREMFAWENMVVDSWKKAKEKYKIKWSI